MRIARALSQAGLDGGITPRVLSSVEEMPHVKTEEVPVELVQRGVRLAVESQRPVAQVARDLGMSPETLRRAVRQAEADGGLRSDLPSTAEREEIKQRRENFELRRANEILETASAFFARELDADRTR